MIYVAGSSHIGGRLACLEEAFTEHAPLQSPELAPSNRSNISNCPAPHGSTVYQIHHGNSRIEPGVWLNCERLFEVGKSAELRNAKHGMKAPGSEGRIEARGASTYFRVFDFFAFPDFPNWMLSRGASLRIRSRMDCRRFRGCLPLAPVTGDCSSQSLGTS